MKFELDLDPADVAWIIKVKLQKEEVCEDKLASIGDIILSGIKIDVN